MKKLLHSPKMYADESLSGFLIRAVQDVYPLNFIHSEFDQFKNLKSWRPTNYNLDVRELSQNDLNFITTLLWINKKDMEKMMLTTLDSTNGYYQFFDTKAHISSISILKAKVCPYCLREKEYFRKIWHHMNVSACPYHGCLLIDKCLNCSKSITWQSANILKCECGFAHKLAEPNIASSECIMLSTLVYQKVGLIAKRPIELNNFFIDAVLIEFDDIFFLLASFIGEIQFRSQFTSSKASIHKVAIIQKQVMEILINWPLGFHQFLNEKRTKSGEDNAERILSSFGNFYIQLKRDRRNSYLFLAKEFINYLLINISSFFASPNFSKIVNQFETLILTGQNALKYFGVSRRTLINLIKACEVDGMIVEYDGETWIHVTKTSADQYLEKKRMMYLTKQEAQDYLNVGYKCITDLLNKGIITFSNDVHKNMIEKDMLDQLSINLENSIVVKEDADLVTFDKAIPQIYGFTDGDVVKFILSREITPRGKSTRRGIKSLLFDRNEVSEFLNHQSKNVIGNLLLTADVARILKVKTTTIDFWVLLGILKCAEKDKIYGKLFFPHEVRQFDESYITVTQLKDLKIGLKEKISASFLIKKGIVPVTGGKEIGERTYLFKRVEVMELISNLMRVKELSLS
ncbi:TniQ family protein [Gorillibacterium massiliense]|uniref:TniQ family protein n=1 Tax=Gorillibacterium massiliense TaxID=1280390 RepID=UPI0004B06490|nr:TniQ family protein [Gorillibacterium massiliense]